jgi:thiol-disulfide isomerase/thioredoxin
MLRKSLFPLVLSCLLAFVAVHVNAQGYDIKIKFPQYKDSTVILAHYFGSIKTLISDDTVKLSHQGTGTLKHNKPLPEGMYLVIFAHGKYFDMLLGNNQTMSIEGDTSNFLRTLKFTGSPENKAYYEYLNLVTDKIKERQKLVERKNKSTNTAQKDSIVKVLEAMNRDMMAYIKSLKTDHPTWFFSTWLKSLDEVQVPDFPRDDKGKILDSLFQAKYYRAHYFDNFDYTDMRLLRTVFYEQKIKGYLENAIPPMPDTISMEVDKMLEKTRDNKELFRYLLGTFFNQYASSQIMGQDAVVASIAEKWYIPYATWASKESIEKLKTEIARVKPNIIGKQAPNIDLIEVTSDHFMAAKSDTAIKNNVHIGNLININGVKAKYLILAFWESDCGHCQKEMPVLYDTVYQDLKDKGIQVVAVHMVGSVEGKRKWVDFVNDHHMYAWINATPATLDYKDLYNVYTTPTIYILDENKKILAKKIGVHQIEEIINADIKRKQKVDRR